MLSGAPARICPAAIPHGGTLLPLNASSSCHSLQSCCAPRTCLSRPSSDFAQQFSCSRTSQQPDRRYNPARHLCISRGHDLQPGPQDDGCVCPGLGSSGTQQPSAHPDNTASQHTAPSLPPPPPLLNSTSGAPTSLPLHRSLGPAPGLGVPASRSSEPGEHPEQSQGDLPDEHQPGSSSNSGGVLASGSVENGLERNCGPRTDFELPRGDEANACSGLPSTSSVSSSVNVGGEGAADPLSRPDSGVLDITQPPPQHSNSTSPSTPPQDLHLDGGGEGRDLHHLHHEEQQQRQQPSQEGGHHGSWLSPPLEHLPGGAPGPLPRHEAHGSGAADVTASNCDPSSEPRFPALPGFLGVSGRGVQLPPLRLDFLNWSALEDEAGSRGGSSGMPPSRSPGTPRRRKVAPATEGRSRSDRILHLVLAAKTLLQVRAVVNRHLSDMSAAAAAVALSRLAVLSLATMRLRRAQLKHHPQSQSEPHLQPQQNSQRQQQEGEEGTSEAEESRGAGTSSRDGKTVSPAALQAAVRSTAKADNDADPDADPSARVQQGSLRLMRMLLWHIALCVDTSGTAATVAARAGGGGGGGGTRWRGPGGGVAGSAAATPRSSSRASSNPGRSRTSASSPSWRLHPPEHRARLAGNVLATLARVGLKPGPSDLWALYRLLEAARPDLFLASPQQLARLASSLPLLPPLRPSPTWLEHFSSVSRSKMYAAEPAHLAAYVWCLARMGHSPGDLWLHSLTHHLKRDGNLRTASPGQLCQVLWALCRLEFSPDPDWREDCTASIRAALTAATGGAASRRSLAQSPGGAVGRRGSRRYDRVDERDSEEDELYDNSPSLNEYEPEMEAVMSPRAAAGTAGAMTARRYGNCYADVTSLLLWAVRMDMAPEAAGMQLCLDQLQPALRSLRRVHLLRLLLALSEAGHRPTEAFMGRLLACLQPKLPLLGPTQLTQLLVAVSRLRFVPPQSWLVAFLKASRAQLRHYSPALVTATYQIFAGWQLRPSRPYLESLHALLDSLMPEFPPQALAAVLHSMASLGIKPQHRWLARALEMLTAAAARTAAGAADAGAVPTHGSVLGLDAAPSPFASSIAFPSSSPLGSGTKGGYLSPGPADLFPTSSRGTSGSPASSSNWGKQRQQQQQTLRQQQRAEAAAALVTAVCSLRGVVQFDAGQSFRLISTDVGVAVGSTASVETAAAAVQGGMPRHAADGSGDGSRGNEFVTSAVPNDRAMLMPYELWSATKQLTDLCTELLDDVMSGPDLARLLTALDRVNFYPGRTFLAAHARATARVGAQLTPADKEALAACYSRLAVLAPQMAEEARRQAEVRQARTSVMVADPWMD